MTDVTRILSAIKQGDPVATEQLLPLVYDELRKLATHMMAQETPGQTLQATALVHEAYLRLVDVEQAQNWNSRGHFFASAAEAMRRILVESARQKKRLKRGGEFGRLEFDQAELISNSSPDAVLALNDAIEKLTGEDPDAAQVVKLRCFTGVSIEQSAAMIGISRSNAYDQWAYALAWLRCELSDAEDER